MPRLLPLSTFAASMEAKDRWGSEGAVHTVRVVDSTKRFKLDYRVGVLRRGRYLDYGRGVTWEAALNQADRAEARRKIAAALEQGRSTKEAEAAFSAFPLEPIRNHAVKLSDHSQQLLADLVREFSGRPKLARHSKEAEL